MSLGMVWIKLHYKSKYLVFTVVDIFSFLSFTGLESNIAVMSGETASVSSPEAKWTEVRGQINSHGKDFY